MRRAIICLILAVFAAGCIQQVADLGSDNESCEAANDCIGLEKPELECLGIWKCESKECAYKCVVDSEGKVSDDIPKPPMPTGGE